MTERTIREGYAVIPAGGVAGTSGSDTLTGTSGIDFLFGRTGTDVVSGGAGDDFVQGNEDSDTVYGDAGDDIARGGKGDDFVYGGAGDDIVFGDEGNDFVSGDDGDDILLGRQASDTLSGGAGNDILYGGEGGDSLNGGDGEDTLHGDNGSDTLTGGAGLDLFVVRKEANVTEYITDFNSAEQVRLTGFGSSPITLYVSHTTGDTSVNLGDGQFIIFLGTSQSSITSSSFLYSGVITIAASSSGVVDDSLYFSPTDDYLDGGLGQDSFIATDGSYVQTGDTVIGGLGSDSIIINGGILTFDSATHANITGVEWFQLNSDAAHVLTFGAGYFSAGTGITNNIVKISTTATTAGITVDGSSVFNTTECFSINGGEGSDSIISGGGADTINGGNGSDSIWGYEGADLIYGGNGADTIAGDEGSNTVYGDAGDDIIFINNIGNEFIDAGSGNDVLDIDVAQLDNNDTVTGGSGNADILRVTSGTASLSTAVMTNLSGFEQIHLNTNAAHTITLNDSYYSSSGFSGHIVIVTTTSNVGVNINGSGLTGANSINVTAGSGDDTISGGAGNDTMEFASANLDSNDTISGGSGNADVLRISSGTLTLNTSTFSNLVGVEQFQLNSNAAHIITLNDGYYSSTGFSGLITTVTTTSTTGIIVNASGLTGTRVINATGGDGADTIQGGAGNDTITLGFGSDSILGGAGNDSIIGVSGNKYIDGGAGNDTIEINGDDLDSNDTITGGITATNADQLKVTSGTLNLNTSTMTNFTGIESINISSSSTSSHSITLNDAYFSSSGYSGNGFGIDSRTASGAVNVDSSSVTLTTKAVSIMKGAGLLNYQGGASRDSITIQNPSHFSVNDTLSGGGGGQIDSLEFSFNSSTSASLFYDSNVYTNITGVEGFYVYNIYSAHSFTFHDAYFSTSGFNADGTLYFTSYTAGGGVNPGITFDSSNVTTSTNEVRFASGHGADFVTFGNGSDTIDTGGGADTVYAGGGSDSIVGNVGGTGNHYIDAGAGADTINHISGSHTIFGGSGDDYIVYKTGNYSIDGGADSDTIQGGGSFDNNDTFSGGSGNLDLFYAIGSSALTFNTNTLTNFSGFEAIRIQGNFAHSITIGDAYFSSAGFEGFGGDSGRLYIYTNNNHTNGISLDASGVTTNTNKINFNMSATGNYNGNDTIIGGAGSDSFAAAGGADTITGGGGADSMSGGSGADVFVYLATSNSTSANRDTITDFDGTTDILRFTGLQTGTFNFIGAHTNAFNGGDLNSEARFNDTTKLLEIDTNGDATVDMEITLTAVTLASMSNADFSWT